MPSRSSSPRAQTPSERLATYRAKRDFRGTPEPKAARRPRAGGPLSFVVQKHDATRLHYDFRLELDGVLVSWAVPKGPSLDPVDKRMAVQTEDHPLSYADFEGTIPEGHYGAGEVIVWDRGRWEPVDDPHEGLAKGKLSFRLHGHKLHGAWELVRLGGRQAAVGPKSSWLLIKRRDEHARAHADYDVVSAAPDSVLHLEAAPDERAQDGPEGRRAALPKAIEPQLATLSSAAPPSGEWVYEIKFDGYRILTRVQGHTPRLITRQGHDWTERMPALARELAALKLGDAWLDGEVVVLDDDGVPDFNALQNAFDRRATRQLTYYVFDLLYHDGRDLRDEPLRTRRERLRTLLAGRETDHVRFSVDAGADAATVLAAACRLRLEGVIAKQADAPYRSGRGTAWLKLKCQQRQEFVIGGFTDREGHPGEVGALLLGVHDEQGRLQSVGRVGTGWDAAQGRALRERLAALETDRSPFDGTVEGSTRWRRGPGAAPHWVKPACLAEVAFGSWTPAGQVRHAAFVGLRADKAPRAIIREKAVAPAAARARGKAARTEPADASTLKVSHPERVIDPSTGTTKLDLVRYYDSVADWLLPHLKDRAVAQVRGPQGIGGQLFFQRHDPADEDPDAPVRIGSRAALLAAAQLNVIELHTGNARLRNPHKADRMVFDLDPGEGVPFAQVQEAALLVRALLQELSLAAWLKTSGGKGLHVVVPLAVRWTLDETKQVSKAIVEHLARTLPDRFVAKSGPSNRVGRIFVDYLRNGERATTVAPFSARARPGMGVSMPVAWEQLGELRSGAHWTVHTARDHLSFRREDPWQGQAEARQSLTPALRALGLKLAPRS
ncbi:DNA ligase D [Ideonella sp.]|uniref:DNA ligase D n=1 Tax=Ideonella sp. TaxID=1929293 RepID=UPI0035B0BD6D